MKLDPTIKLDIRYAGTNNFLGKPVYKESRAFLQRPAAEALLKAHRELAKSGYGLLIHDGYRPWAITKLFWDMTSGFQREFVANPATGSKHNRGCAVDLTMYDLATGQAVEMPGGYDEMTPRSYPDYPGGTAEAARAARSAAEGDGEPRLHRRAERVVALQLQGLEGIPDSRHCFFRNQIAGSMRYAEGRCMEYLIDLFLHLDVHLAEFVAQYGVWVYAMLFAIIFARPVWSITPFLPGDSLLFAAGALAATGAMDI